MRRVREDVRYYSVPVVSLAELGTVRLALRATTAYVPAKRLTARRWRLSTVRCPRRQLALLQRSLRTDGTVDCWGLGKASTCDVRLTEWPPSRSPSAQCQRRHEASVLTGSENRHNHQLAGDPITPPTNAALGHLPELPRRPRRCLVRRRRGQTRRVEDHRRLRRRHDVLPRTRHHPSPDGHVPLPRREPLRNRSVIGSPTLGCRFRR